jgi:hypothetical protein
LAIQFKTICTDSGSSSTTKQRKGGIAEVVSGSVLGISVEYFIMASRKVQ